jgi:hypothetical protein
MMQGLYILCSWNAIIIWHLEVESESEFVEQTRDVDCSLDIFEMVTKTSELSKKLSKQSS